MNSKFFIFVIFVISISILLIPSVHAHCPLCTMGAMAAASGASYLGVSNAIVGLFTGAFAVSTGWWVADRIKKKYLPHQKALLIISSFLLTIVPIVYLIMDYYPIYISWGGAYGSIFNRTYIFNKFLVGSIIGGAVLFFTPWLSKKITEWRKGKMVPYQGLSLTFLILINLALFIQFFMR